MNALEASAARPVSIEGPLPVVRKELAGWGNFPRAVCAVASPAGSLVDLASWRQYASLTPRGLGRSYGDASLPTEAGLAIETARQAAIASFDVERGIVTATAGTPLATIVDASVPHGWFLPITPGTRWVSLGGSVAANVHGKNHHRSGAIEHYIESLSLLTEQGPVECSRDANRELFDATVGGFGMTGLIQSVALRLKPIETAVLRTQTHRARDLDELLAILTEHEPRHEFSLSWIDTLAPPRSLGRGVAMFGDHARRDDLPARLQDEPLQNAWRRPHRVPAALGRLVTSPLCNRWLNRSYYHLPRRQEELATIEQWFYPLDAVVAWNKLYGAAGFLQYQCVLPHARDSARGLRRILEALARRRVGSFVAGLKSMRGDEVLLPFGMPGYTFGIDFSRRTAGLNELLDELDRIVLEHGGRVALSKDARLSAATFRAMYPEFPQWLEAVRRWAPGRRFASRLAERLQW